MATSISNPFRLTVRAAAEPAVQIASTVGGANLPFSFGIGFPKGQITSQEIALSLPSAQAVVKRRWNDGSIKHAVVSGAATLSAGAHSLKVEYFEFGHDAQIYVWWEKR